MMLKLLVSQKIITEKEGVHCIANGAKITCKCMINKNACMGSLNKM